MAWQRFLFAIFAFCSVTTVYSRSVEYCIANPSEWCSNFTIASECNAVQYCIEGSWKNGNLLSLDGSSCETCIQGIDSIRQGLDSNITKDAIQSVLDSVCQMTVVTKILTKECEKLIDTYVDSHINDLLDLLRSDVDPQVICKVLDLCSSPSQDLEPEDAAVYYDNIVLHIPASNLQIISRISEPVKHELLGAQKCTWGPSYWCGNLTTSKECKSTTHCIATQWSQKVFEEDDDSVCQVCKDMVKQARDQLLSNETQEELLEVFEGSCKLIPLEEIRKECIKLADEFVPELTEVLASQMNPTAVCTVAGLCNSPRIDNLLSANGPLGMMDSCTNCTAAFTLVERYMQSASKDDLLGKMLGVCGQLSSYSDLCASLIKGNIDDLYNTMKNQFPPSAACHFTGMCAHKYHAHMDILDVHLQNRVEKMLSPPNDDLPCDLCKQLVLHLQQVLTANTTEEEFRLMLLGMCQQTGNFKNECSKLVEDNFHIIYAFLTEELDPPKICAEIAICPLSPNLVSDTDLNLIPGRVDPGSIQDVSLINLSPPRVAESIAKADGQDDSVPCKFCHTIIGIIQSTLNDPTDEKEVKEALEKVCKMVPSSDKTRCEKFVEEYADILIKALADETNPFEVCRDIKLCPGPSNSHEVNVKPDSSSVLCPFCQDIMHYIQNELNDPTEDAKIEEAVKGVCNVVPASIKDKCDEFISQYSALIITILSQEADPSLVCPALNLCPSPSSPKEQCIECRTYMNKLIQYLDGDTNNLEHVKDEVTLFTQLPLRGQKKSVMALQLGTLHKEKLIDMMLAEFDADESCVFLKYCDVESVSTPLPTPVVDGGDLDTNEIISHPPYYNKPSCEICELFVKMYEKELTSNKTEEELKDMLEHVCQKMKNKNLKANCTSLVDKYVPLFLDLLKNNVSPKELCAAAKLCSLSTLTEKFDTDCKSCEIIVGSLESVLGDPVVRQDMFERVVKFCDSMEGRSRSVCYAIATEVLPQVESAIFEIPAWFVCAKLRMCPYGDRVDMSACASPQRWCTDKQTAFMCDRLDYCRKNAWMYPIP